ncbi:MAG: twin-arginine translocase TatA/TatE family subunit [Desulfarculus sp.]|nr:twin-arginine translocase TatA/TatE family subunit [Desulfarculus sp.]
MIGGIGLPELLIILVIVLLIFGANKLPQIGQNVGKAIKNFKGSVAEDKIEDQGARTEKIEEQAKREKTEA